MDKLKIAVIGLGNIGSAVCEAVLEAPDMQLCGIVRRSKTEPQAFGAPIVTDIGELGHIDVAILCGPSRQVPEAAEKYLKMGISTVDSFDIHSEIWPLRQRLDPVAKANGACAVIAAGWDPGTDSIVRAMLLAMAPSGITHTNFGPGMSMGHSVAAAAVKGVKNALSLTLPAGSGVHKRHVYIELEPGADFAETARLIKADPYFAHDDTTVTQTDDVSALMDKGHGVSLTRKGVSGRTHNQRFEFGMSIQNPALTGQIMVSCARAAARREPGCYTTIELPVIDLLPGSREELIKTLV